MTVAQVFLHEIHLKKSELEATKKRCRKKYATNL